MRFASSSQSTFVPGRISDHRSRTGEVGLLIEHRVGVCEGLRIARDIELVVQFGEQSLFSAKLEMRFKPGEECRRFLQDVVVRLLHTPPLDNALEGQERRYEVILHTGFPGPAPRQGLFVDRIAEIYPH